jgi:hypothetical protein
MLAAVASLVKPMLDCGTHDATAGIDSKRSDST